MGRLEAPVASIQTKCFEMKNHPSSLEAPASKSPNLVTPHLERSTSGMSAMQGLALLRVSAQPEPFLVIDPTHRQRVSHKTCLR